MLDTSGGRCRKGQKGRAVLPFPPQIRTGVRKISKALPASTERRWMAKGVSGGLIGPGKEKIPAAKTKFVGRNATEEGSIDARRRGKNKRTTKLTVDEHEAGRADMRKESLVRTSRGGDQKKGGKKRNEHLYTKMRSSSRNAKPSKRHLWTSNARDGKRIGSGLKKCSPDNEHPDRQQKRKNRAGSGNEERIYLLRTRTVRKRATGKEEFEGTGEKKLGQWRRNGA